METTPRGMRLHLGLMGRTNVGKSSFLNLLAGQDVAVTSPLPGTTTDVVEKPMELLPVGPVVFLDTGGLDDTSTLAHLRVERTRQALRRAEVVVLVLEPDVWTPHEDQVVQWAHEAKLPLLCVINKCDLAPPSEAFLANVRGHTPFVITCSSLAPAQRDAVLTEFKRHLLLAVPPDRIQGPSLVGDLLPAGGLVVLIVPIDLEAPKGRLILPQVQAIRDALDHDAAALVVKEKEYAPLLERLKQPPDLVVCDSQVVLRMIADTPPAVPCTTFSILFARLKGDLLAQAQAATTIDRLQAGDRVLIAEACSHHPLQDDIGRIKIPRWLRQYTGLDLQIDTVAGRDYPANLEQYKLVIHCGACMLTRKEMQVRLAEARQHGVAITNYGIAISHLQGVLPRVVKPFGLEL